MNAQIGKPAHPTADTWRAAATVFVVSADASVRESLELLIRAAGWQPKMAGSAEEFLARPRLMVPGCVLAELHLPALTGLELQRLIAERSEMPVIFMSEHVDVQSAIQAVRAGAVDILTKPLLTDSLLPVIRCAIERSRAALSELARIRVLQERYKSLSAREREVTSLVVSGRLNKQVGGDLGICEYTVKVHRGRAMRKMGAASFAELVTMVESLRRWTGTTEAHVHRSSDAHRPYHFGAVSSPASTDRFGQAMLVPLVSV